MLDVFKGKVTAQDWAFVGVVAAIIGALVVAFVFLVQAPKKRELQALQEQDAQVRKDLQEAMVKQKKLPELKQEMELYQKLVTDFADRLPSEREIPVLITQFEDLAKEVGLEVDLKPLPPEDDGQKETIPYSVTAYGNFHQITTFINLLERHKRYFRVSELEIKQEKMGISEAKFTISTFRITKKAPEPPSKEGEKAAPKVGQEAAS